jgi:GT2 family glycosyltransferase
VSHSGVQLSVLVLVYNRKDALRRTLMELREQGIPGALASSPDISTELIVADNGSTDGSGFVVQQEFARARLVTLPANIGVDAFNHAAREARGEFLLILDDDCWPEPGVLHAALAAMRDDQTIAGVALVPTHPATRRSEWPFARARTDHFPAFGAANLVRASVWRELGGYEPAFFLYRNDADLALSMLDAGHKVLMNPAWIAWHDSPAAALKSERWLHLATRNWTWMCRRHAFCFPSALAASLLGALWGLRLAGLDVDRLDRAAKGFIEGWMRPPPPPPPAKSRGTALGLLLRTQLRSKFQPSPSASTKTPASFNP